MPLSRNKHLIVVSREKSGSNAPRGPPPRSLAGAVARGRARSSPAAPARPKHELNGEGPACHSVQCTRCINTNGTALVCPPWPLFVFACLSTHLELSYAVEVGRGALIRWCRAGHKTGHAQPCRPRLVVRVRHGLCIYRSSVNPACGFTHSSRGDSTMTPIRHLSTKMQSFAQFDSRARYGQAELHHARLSATVCMYVSRAFIACCKLCLCRGEITY